MHGSLVRHNVDASLAMPQTLLNHTPTKSAAHSPGVTSATRHLTPFASPLCYHASVAAVHETVAGAEKSEHGRCDTTDQLHGHGCGELMVDQLLMFSLLNGLTRSACHPPLPWALSLWSAAPPPSAASPASTAAAR